MFPRSFSICLAAGEHPHGNIELTKLRIVHKSNEVYHADFELSVDLSCNTQFEQVTPMPLTPSSFQISHSPIFIRYYRGRPLFEEYSFISMRILVSPLRQCHRAQKC